MCSGSKQDKPFCIVKDPSNFLPCYPCPPSQAGGAHCVSPRPPSTPFTNSSPCSCASCSLGGAGSSPDPFICLGSCWKENPFSDVTPWSLPWLLPPHTELALKAIFVPSSRVPAAAVWVGLSSLEWTVLAVVLVCEYVSTATWERRVPPSLPPWLVLTHWES